MVLWLYYIFVTCACNEVFIEYSPRFLSWRIEKRLTGWIINFFISLESYIIEDSVFVILYY